MELGRIISILFSQLIISLLSYILSFKILYRKKNHLTINLSVFYIFIATGFVLNAIFLLFSKISFIKNFPIILYILYFLAIYLIFFSFIFVLIFIYDLIQIDSKFSLKKYLIMIIFYGVSIFLILLFPNGININETTNWRPVYSWSFLILIYIYFTSLIFVPVMFFLIKLYKSFEDNNLKSKMKYFSMGIAGMVIIFLGSILYNTWRNTVFGIIWPIITLLIIPFGLLIYFGIGRDL